jgi:hypothetical protein
MSSSACSGAAGALASSLRITISGIPSSRSLRERIRPARVALCTGPAQVSFYSIFLPFLFSFFFTVFYKSQQL